ncbi:hypothetical protein PsorP6_003872 [Peronosclerospora sorghi]|uniref:Uncharacterized protein n=1 Tax=Peronosclerospora sorghi TaxID=230839 RepID=A0ACC0VLK3_9STRA|nr:hypothetical protein PsorP6_003872 [Peronosclerospora sorghi]
MALSRNFRTTYYKTLGVPVVQHIVDLEASFAALLSERIVNVQQLLKLALEIGIAPQYRARSWLLLAGVLPPYPGLWSFALMERRAMFEDVIGAAQVLQVKEVAEDEEDSGIYYNFNELLEEKHGQEEEKISLHYLKRLLHLYRTYRQEIDTSSVPLLNGMNDSNFLLGVARVVCEVLTDESERFWGLTRLLELLQDGLELVDPIGSIENLYDARPVDFEGVFLRTLDVKRRRQTVDGSILSLHSL